jgi:hypothetical protein
MRRVLVVALALVAGPALAQERSFTITLTDAQVNYIGKVLGKQPFEDVAPVINVMQQQINAQMAAAQQAAQKAAEAANNQEPKK